MIDYDNKEMELLIDSYIHNARNRQILKDRLIDGMSYKELEGKYNLTDRHIKRIVYTSQDKLFKHIKV